MLSNRLLRDHPDVARAGLRRRGDDAETRQALEEWLTLDAERRALNKRVGTTNGSARSEAVALQERMRALALRLPNIPAASVPEGLAPAQNVELRRWGDVAPLPFPTSTHDQLGVALGMLDPPRATKLAGPRFPLLVGAGAHMARALASLLLDLHRAHGYVEVAPPHLLKAQTLEGTGHLPRHANALFAVERDGLYLSPTAETQLVALHAGETVPERLLPLAYTACTPCFRREAGSSGAAMRGLLRQRQFDKVELVRVTAPETADDAFETLVLDAERALRLLELPYRVVALCCGELPFASQRTVDLEVWLVGEARYVEIASISDCGAFQARRLSIRYQPRSGGRSRYPVTLNGSALPIGRTIAALLERHQQADGSVRLPEALAPYHSERRLPPIGQ
jgi:seryl-tRNA synthetase